MIKIENISISNIDNAIRGLRNPMNSWDKSDSFICYKMSCEKCPYGEKIPETNQAVLCRGERAKDGKLWTLYPQFYEIGPNDLNLCRRMIKDGSSDSKFLRQIFVSMDITAPLYWWKEMDQYKVGTTTDSCSTMHRIHAKRFEREDFSTEHLENCEEPHWLCTMDNVISALNVAREKYLETKDKKYWWQMIQLLPTSYNQKRTWTGSYANLRNIFHQRKSHKLDEWREFCKIIEGLPYGKELITYEDK